MKRKIFYFIILLSVISFFLIKYYKYYNLYGDIDKEVIEIQKNIYDFFYYSGNEELTNKNQIKRLNLCLPKLKEIKILKNGYKVINSKKGDSFIFYVFGEDKKDNDLNKLPFNSIDNLNSYNLNKLTFINFLFNFGEYDIVLFNYKRTGNAFLYNNSHFKEKILFLNESCKEIDKAIEENIIAAIQKVESIYIDKTRRKITYEDVGKKRKYRQIFFKIDKEKITHLNSNGVSEKKIEELESILKKELFKLNGIKKVDYAFFSLLIKAEI